MPNFSSSLKTNNTPWTLDTAGRVGCPHTSSRTHYLGRSDTTRQERGGNMWRRREVGVASGCLRAVTSVGPFLQLGGPLCRQAANNHVFKETVLLCKVGLHTHTHPPSLSAVGVK